MFDPPAKHRVRIGEDNVLAEVQLRGRCEHIEQHIQAPCPEGLPLVLAVAPHHPRVRSRLHLGGKVRPLLVGEEGTEAVVIEPLSDWDCGARASVEGPVVQGA